MKQESFKISHRFISLANSIRRKRGRKGLVSIVFVGMLAMTVMFTGLMHKSSSAFLAKIHGEKAAQAGIIAAAMYAQWNGTEDLGAIEGVFGGVFSDYMDVNGFEHSDSAPSASLGDQGMLSIDYGSLISNRGSSFGVDSLDQVSVSGTTKFLLAPTGKNVALVVVSDVSNSMTADQLDVVKEATKNVVDIISQNSLDGRFAFGFRTFNLYCDEDRQNYDPITGELILDEKAGKTNEPVPFGVYELSDVEHIKQLIDLTQQFGDWGSYAPCAYHKGWVSLEDFYDSLPDIEKESWLVMLILLSDGKINTVSKKSRYFSYTNKGKNCGYNSGSSENKRYRLAWAWTISEADEMPSYIETYGIMTRPEGDPMPEFSDMKVQNFADAVDDNNIWDGEIHYRTGRNQDDPCRDGYDGPTLKGSDAKERLYFATLSDQDPVNSLLHVIEELMQNALIASVRYR
ncbi:MAG: VWA domain-containing protein [Candidatus Dadabacteria bacterium]|nr:MAG: VWA domain-containing protein [Candidatus Dadabacteria bacterium]